MRFKLALLWLKIRNWFDFDVCYKESLGYTCRHREYADGTKECGEYPNYWKGNN